MPNNNFKDQLRAVRPAVAEQRKHIQPQVIDAKFDKLWKNWGDKVRNGMPVQLAEARLRHMRRRHEAKGRFDEVATVLAVEMMIGKTFRFEVIGTEEGDKCLRNNCAGTLRFKEVEGCTCFQVAPCSQCEHNPLECDTCFWNSKDDD